MVVALSARMDALATRQDRLESQLAASTAKLDAAGTQSGAIAGSIATLGARLTRIATLQGAQAALAAGRPLGDLPGAPPALARYRTDPPPTEAALRRTFPATAAAIRAAASPSAQLGLWRAMRLRAESLVTIRRGDTVLIGSDQIATADRAQQALDAGDLTAADAILATLDGPAAQAAAPWRAQAQALLAARAALLHEIATPATPGSPGAR